MKGRIKRWAKGLLILVAAWFGAGEFPLGQYDAEQKDDEGDAPIGAVEL
jgi:hypothetical protein